MTIEPKPYIVRGGLEGLEPEPPTEPTTPETPPRLSRADRLGRPPASAVPDSATPSASQQPTPQVAGARMPTSTWLPSRLIAKVRTEFTERGIGTGELFKQAVEFGFDELPRLIKESAPVGTAPARTGLFATPSSAIRPRSFNEPTEAITYRMAKADQQILDDLVSKWGATSRGHLIGCALDHYFAHHHHIEE